MANCKRCGFAKCQCSKNLPQAPPPSQNVLVEGVDYTLENGLLVFTREYHLKRGYCCDSGCRHCPYKT